MGRFLQLACAALALTSLAPAAAFARHYAIEATEPPHEKVLVVAGRELEWGPPGELDLWMIKKTEKGYTIRFLSRGSQCDRWYLTAKPGGKGKTRKLFLSEKPTPASYWDVSNVGGPARTSISSRAPKLKGDGWFLDFGPKDQAVLSQPDNPLKFLIYPVAP